MSRTTDRTDITDLTDSIHVIGGIRVIPCRAMSHDFEHLEQRLRRYRPGGPAAVLRDRVLRVGRPESRPLRWWRYAAAAMVLLSAGLMLESARLTQQAPQIAAAEPALPPEAERAVALLGGDEAARKYVALAMAREARNRAVMPHGQTHLLFER